MNTMYDRISQHRHPSQPMRDFSRDFSRDFGSTQSDHEGTNGTMLFYIALGGSAVIFLFSLMLKAVIH